MAHSASSSTINYKNENGVVCRCNRSAKIVKAWTDDNPGRRFYSCVGRKVGSNYESCNFFRWFDIEKPNGWQHLALLEARDVIREQKEELKNLRNAVKALTRNAETVMANPSDELLQTREECEALKQEVLILNERSNVFRNVLVTSSIGFTMVIGVMMAMSKW